MESQNGCLQRRCGHPARQSRHARSRRGRTDPPERWRAGRYARFDRSARPCSISLKGRKLDGGINMSIHIPVLVFCPPGLANMSTLHFGSALLPSGWADDVQVVVTGGTITKVTTGVTPG